MLVQVLTFLSTCLVFDSNNSNKLFTINTLGFPLNPLFLSSALSLISLRLGWGHMDVIPCNQKFFLIKERKYVVILVQYELMTELVVLDVDVWTYYGCAIRFKKRGFNERWRKPETSISTVILSLSMFHQSFSSSMKDGGLLFIPLFVFLLFLNKFHFYFQRKCWLL